MVDIYGTLRPDKTKITIYATTVSSEDLDQRNSKQNGNGSSAVPTGYPTATLTTPSILPTIPKSTQSKVCKMIMKENELKKLKVRAETPMPLPGLQ